MIGLILGGLAALAAYAWIETHWTQITEEIQIGRLVRESWISAQNRRFGRTAAMYGVNGFHPNRRRWHGLR